MGKSLGEKKKKKKNRLFHTKSTFYNEHNNISAIEEVWISQRIV